MSAALIATSIAVSIEVGCAVAEDAELCGKKTLPICCCFIGWYKELPRLTSIHRQRCSDRVVGIVDDALEHTGAYFVDAGYYWLDIVVACGVVLGDADDL